MSAYVIRFGPHVIEVDPDTGRHTITETRPTVQDGLAWTETPEDWRRLPSSQTGKPAPTAEQ